ncbi:hypothetical protein J0J26_02100 [Vibrio vulnificus]|uniref:hypothetical protein n=1 Tax=Vibrio vulnificus TaxID=672 RepID=UPI0019D48FE5|nr:hypothetical protein [Vibrio vulnificus]MBN8087174.1 hypothetical protein [Vibrio vulnificus]MBN8115693.1 hypothetical protein [Vibrio vulnificus]
MSTALITAVLGSSVLSALITQFFLKWKSDRQISIENITQERKEWRVRLRELLVDLVVAVDKKDRVAARKIEAELIVRLNPEDSDDLKILELFPQVYENWNEDTLRELSDRLSYLLKHDWERVKGEVKGGLKVYSLLLATIIAVLSVTSFFFVVEFLSEQKELSLVRISMCFGGWLIGTVLTGCIMDFIFNKKSTKKSSKEIIGLNSRLSYRERSTRNGSDS